MNLQPIDVMSRREKIFFFAESALFICELPRKVFKTEAYRNTISDLLELDVSDMITRSYANRLMLKLYDLRGI
jgi:hypothetical protein